MRNLLLPLLVILVFTSCQKQIPSEKVSEELNSVAAKKPAEKLAVCHYDVENGTWHLIKISLNAWRAHQAHGDVRLDDQDDDGYVPDNECGRGQMGDCDDLNAAIHPGATEICGNEIDENCNGQINENCIPSIIICNQTWMTKNLDVDHYRNGDPIPKVTNSATWASLTTGAYCYYNNDSATYAATYGKLYNWYAVNDPRGLAPTGWHIPSDAEWTTLSTCLGGEAVAGGKMKSTGTIEAGTGLWRAPNTAATNSSRFAGLPGGDRRYDGSFRSFGYYGLWWSSTESSATYAWYRFLYYYDGNFDRNSNYKLFGFSVRCIKD